MIMMKCEYSSSWKHSVLLGNIPQQNFPLVPPSQSFSLTHKFIHHLAFVLVIAFALGWNVPAFAAGSVSYVNRTADASGNVTETNATCTDYTVVTSETTEWSDGWYVVNSDVEIGKRVTVSGTVNLILCDGANLTIEGIWDEDNGGYISYGGITVARGNSLTIYGQTGDSGELDVYDVEDNAAGIGGGSGGAGGTITINGGYVEVFGGTYASSIGGGNNGAGGTITINGGNITATGYEGGAGIGSGQKGEGGTITINGGNVTATGGNYASGIGNYETNDTITLDYTSETDSITASSYSGTVTIVDGKTFTDNTNEYSGSVDDLSAIAGKTLKPYVYTLTLDDNISADYIKPGVGTTVTLSYSGELPAGYEAVFYVNGTEIDDNTFTMPAENVEVTVTLTLSSPIFAAYSMVLGGTLSVRYYVNIPDKYDSADCTIVFDVSGDTSLNPDPCAPTVSKQSGDVTLYGYDCFINSAQMADEIHATLYYDDNSKTIEADPYSAEDYLNKVASDKDSYDAYEVSLIETIRDYGHYVQPCCRRSTAGLSAKNMHLCPAQQLTRQLILTPSRMQ